VSRRPVVQDFASPAVAARAGVWVCFVAAALATIGPLGLTVFGLVAPAVALMIAVVQWRNPPATVTWSRWRPDRQDLAAVAVLYVIIVALFRLAFGVFTQDVVAGLFLSFAAGLLVGVGGPVLYNRRRGRALADVGLTGERLRPTLMLGAAFAAIQFTVTLWGYALPKPVDWVPLLVMAIVVGFFEAIFFRGFVQLRLEDAFGVLPSVGGAALLYSLYHVGYGMAPREMVFLFGLGVVYAIAFRLVRNTLVLWPLLLPLGSFFNTLDSGDITLPWAAILGFADVAALMATVVIWVRRRERRALHATPPARTSASPAHAA